MSLARPRGCYRARLTKRFRSGGPTFLPAGYKPPGARRAPPSFITFETSHDIRATAKGGRQGAATVPGLRRVGGRPRGRRVRHGRCCPVAAVGAGADYRGMVAACMKRRSRRIGRRRRCFTRRSRCPRRPGARSPNSCGAATELATKTLLRARRTGRVSCLPRPSRPRRPDAGCQPVQGVEGRVLGEAHAMFGPAAGTQLSRQSRVDQPPHLRPTQPRTHLVRARWRGSEGFAASLERHWIAV